MIFIPSNSRKKNTPVCSTYKKQPEHFHSVGVEVFWLEWGKILLAIVL